MPPTRASLKPDPFTISIAVMVGVASVLPCSGLAAQAFALATSFSRADTIVLLFCSSKGSLVSAVSFANVLFPAASVGAMVLPLMLYHQLQLMVCAVIAQRFALSAGEPGSETAAT